MLRELSVVDVYIWYLSNQTFELELHKMEWPGGSMCGF